MGGTPAFHVVGRHLDVVSCALRRGEGTLRMQVPLPAQRAGQGGGEESQHATRSTKRDPMARATGSDPPLTPPSSSNAWVMDGLGWSPCPGLRTAMRLGSGSWAAALLPCPIPPHHTEGSSLLLRPASPSLPARKCAHSTPLPAPPPTPAPPGPPTQAPFLPLSPCPPHCHPTHLPHVQALERSLALGAFPAPLPPQPGPPAHRRQPPDGEVQALQLVHHGLPQQR